MTTSKTDAGESKATGKASKKPKSAGFIESSQYRPNWLETGPLSPDMLPPVPPEETAPIQQTGDELAERMAALDRLYAGQDAEGLPSASDNRIHVFHEPDDTETEKAAESGENLDLAVTAVVTEDEAVERAAAPLAVRLAAAEAEMLIESPPSPVVAPVREPEDLAVEAPDTSVDLEAATTRLELEMIAVPVASNVLDEIFTAPIAAETAPVVAPQSPPPSMPAVRVPSQPKPHHHAVFDKTSRRLLVSSLALFGLALLAFLVNPFQRLALGTASLARPSQPTGLPAPAGQETAWCLSGDFLESSAALPRLDDSGQAGDLINDDQVFSLEFPIPTPGAFAWQIVSCTDPSLAYPAAAAWVRTTEANQAVTFLFDAKERQDPLFFPIPYVVSAEDGTTDFSLVGDFQDWDLADPSGKLRQIGPGVYQQVRRIAQPGTHEAYIAVDSTDQAIDAYGRTSEPIPFQFETKQRGDAVVFLVDTNRGRASVLYDMPPLMTQLAYGPGYQLISLVLALLGALLLGWMLSRLVYMRNDHHWLDAGCPNCGKHELMRIGRQSSDRWLHSFGFPAYRYQCRECTWEGVRLSETGVTVSPKAKTVSR